VVETADRQESLTYSHIITAISEIDHEMLQQVWMEMDYWLDTCHVIKGG